MTKLSEMIKKAVSMGQGGRHNESAANPNRLQQRNALSLAGPRCALQKGLFFRQIVKHLFHTLSVLPKSGATLVGKEEHRMRLLAHKLLFDLNVSGGLKFASHLGFSGNF